MANIAQITGIAVTAIVTLGSDTDVLYAVPLGIFAGALASFFVAAAERRAALRARAQAPSAGMLFKASSSSTKDG